MNLDLLLLWLSAKGQGSWSQFRGAVEELCIEQEYDTPETTDDLDRAGVNGSDLPLYQWTRFALQRLGHVEFFSTGTDHDWRVCPTSGRVTSEPAQ